MFIMDELIYPTSRLPEVYDQTRDICQKYEMWDSPIPPVFDGYPIIYIKGGLLNGRESDQRGQA
jgi:hypothetical protein